jgi:hypothetical protein
MGALCGGQDPARRLAENFQRSNGRILVQPAREESGLIEPFDKVPRLTRREQHIKEQRRVSLGNSPIDGFGLFQDRPAAEEIPTCLDGLAFDEIDGRPKSLSSASFKWATPQDRSGRQPRR